MKHPPVENQEIERGCPNTHMNDPLIKPAFEAWVKASHSHLSLHQNENAPHYSSGETRIAYNKFKDSL